MSDQDVVHGTLSRINARAWGIATGLVLGGGLCLATIILVMKGGPDMGQHLGRLTNVLPGYSVSWLGAFVGLVYGFVIGYGLGRLIGPRSPLSGKREPSGTTHVRLNGKAWGLTLGAAAGIALFAVTNLLDVKGGEHPGEFLSNLHLYLPGYRVDFVGSLIGFAYLLAIGFVLGELVAGVYNRAVERAES
ncbi:MAG: hypothetical protein L6Q99_07095 [Planctomycetes bacterium]|nr:hypothetical protein [Planctomycetota bacterium]